MLPDSARIQTQDTKWINKRRKKKGLPPSEPLYSEMNAELCLRQFVNIGYDRPIPIADGVELTFLDAGHILGSAQISLVCKEDGKTKRFLFSGDVGRGDNDLLRDPEVPENIDFLLMESTYGDREHELPAQANDLLSDILVKALEKKGKVIIPSFAVERTQQLIYVLHELTEAKKIPNVPIFVDSPLAVGATEIFRIHPECFNEEVYNFLFEKRDPFGFENLSLVRKVTESIALNDLHEPAIIISASGMCEAGRIMHHLRNNIEDPKKTILFVGYCAEQTLGWKIREGWDEVNILGDPFKVKANVEILDSFSGHADQSELIDYFKAMTGSREKVWLVHGEPEQAKGLKKALDGFHDGDVTIAEWKNEVEF